MKVLHIPTGGLLPDGIFSCIAAYFAAMDRTDLDLTLLATNTPSEAMLAQADQLKCDVKVLGGRRSNPVKYYFALLRYLKEEGFDIVHVHGSSAIMSIELKAAKKAGCRIRIAHSHNTTCDNKRIDRILRPFFSRTYTHAFACGRDAGRWLFRDETKFVVIPNGRDLAKFKYNEENRNKWRKELGIKNNNTRVYAHVGAFNYQKNHDYLIDVFNEIHKFDAEAMLVLVGSGDGMVSIKEKVNALGLSHNVIFMGNIDNVHEVLSAFDMMLFPSRFEGLPLVVLEWQANGLPCLISEEITDECCITRWVNKRSITEMPRVWCDNVRLATLPDRAEASRIGCQQLREGGYDIHIEAQRLKKIYKLIMEEVAS